jgi:hypothetical protein
MEEGDRNISCPITGLKRPTGFQEVKVPIFLGFGT